MASVIDLTLGGLEVGTMISILLFGIITVQVYLYAQAGFKDHVVIRLLVGTMWVLDALHTIFLCIYLYHLTVSTYGQPTALAEIHWTYVGVILLNSVMAAAVQSFFAYRILVISGRLYISLFSWFISLVRLGMGLMVVVLSDKAWMFSVYMEKYAWTIPTSLAILSFGDFLNTSVLCYFLSAHRSQNAPTNQVINKLIIWAIETGLVTTVCAITELILSVTMPQSLIWIGLYFFFPKFYSISMLTSLNNRRHLRSISSSFSKDDGLASVVQFSQNISVNRVQEVNVEMSSTKPDHEEADDYSERRGVIDGFTTGVVP